jgi:hypothetical protein
MQRVSEWVIVVKRQMGILFSGISWREHVTFIDMMILTLYSVNTLGWIFIVLTHCHYSHGQICRSTLTHYSESEPTSLCSFSLMLRA